MEQRSRAACCRNLHGGSSISSTKGRQNVCSLELEPYGFMYPATCIFVARAGGIVYTGIVCMAGKDDMCGIIYSG
jgi:hypothetical protein